MLEPKASRLSALTADYLDEFAGVMALVSAEAVAEATALLLEVRSAGGRVYILGNGGSAATASHFVCDLVKTARVAGLEPIRAFSLTDNVPLFSAWANDSAYERTFAEQIASLVDPGDVVIGITASGNSPNVVAGLSAAARSGARRIGLLGFDGGAARSLVDVAIHVPYNDYGLVEAAHGAICHAISTAIYRTLSSQALV